MTLDQEDITAIAAEVVRQLSLLAQNHLKAGLNMPLPRKGAPPAKEDIKKENRRTGDRLLNTFEAAQIIGSTEKTLRKYRCIGRGPAYVKVGKSVRYRESDIREYIKGLG